MRLASSGATPVRSVTGDSPGWDRWNSAAHFPDCFYEACRNQARRICLQINSDEDEVSQLTQSVSPVVLTLQMAFVGETVSSHSDPRNF